MDNPQEPSAQARTWAQIDHQLVSLKQEQAVKEIHEKHEQRRRACDKGNSGTDFAAVVKLYIEEASESAENLFQIYKEVWEKQGMPRTPDFLRSIMSPGLLPVIEARTRPSVEQLAVCLAGMQENPAKIAMSKHLRA